MKMLSLVILDADVGPHFILIFIVFCLLKIVYNYLNNNVIDSPL